jgi:hypothetical protein
MATIIIALIAVGAAFIDIRSAWTIWLLFLILCVPLGGLYARLLGGGGPRDAPRLKRCG